VSARAHQAALEALLDQVYEYFMVALPDHVRRMYAQDLAAFPVNDVAWAIDAYRLQPPPQGHKKAPPKPLDLIAMLRNEVGDKQAADTIASTIWGSIALFGRTQAKAAMARIGPAGERVVQQMGGWELLCRSCCADDANMWHAQLRDKALAVMAQARQAQAFASLAEATARMPQLGAATTQQLPDRCPDGQAMQTLGAILEQVRRHAAPQAVHAR
jgi:hypothetical protein